MRYEQMARDEKNLAKPESMEYDKYRQDNVGNIIAVSITRTTIIHVLSL